MNGHAQKAFFISWEGQHYPTYDIDLKSYKRKAFAGLSRGVYAQVSDEKIEFGRSKQLANRLTSRKSTDKWAHWFSTWPKILAVMPSVRWCICLTARRGSGRRTLRNIRCRNSLGGYSWRSPIVELDEEWRRLVFAYLAERDDPYHPSMDDLNLRLDGNPKL